MFLPKEKTLLKFCFFVNRMFAAELAVFAHREFLGVRFFVFARVIVATCALFTGEVDIFTHGYFLVCESGNPITQ